MYGKTEFFKKFLYFSISLRYTVRRMDEDMKKKLDEMLARGEITEELYKEILSRLEEEEGTEKRSENGEEEKLSFAEGLRVGGAVSFDSSLRTEIFKVGGSASVNGNLIAEEVSVGGALKVNGKIEAEKIKVGGSLKCKEIYCEFFSIGGSARVDNKISAEIVKVGGAIKTKEIEAEVVEIGGAVKAEKIQAEKISLKLGGKSEVGRIEAEIVDIKQTRGGFLGREKGKLVADEIKGFVINLEGTTAKRVIGSSQEGSKVVIGRNCEVDYVEGREIEIHPNAKIKEKKILE